VGGCLTFAAERYELCPLHLADRDSPTSPGRLPVRPAAVTLVRRYGAIRRAGKAMEVRISRARRAGGFTALEADAFAGRVDLHPADIWGRSWWAALLPDEVDG
jgi:hypothetical protein